MTRPKHLAAENRGIYPDDLAERLKKRVGEKYRPSNGEEGLYFARAWCNDCKHETEQSPCLIWTMAHFLKTESREYPAELQYGPDGQPRCTAHEPALPTTGAET